MPSRPPSHLYPLPYPPCAMSTDSETLLSSAAGDGLDFVETSSLIDSTNQSVHIRLTSSSLSITSDGRPALTFDVDDLVGCTTGQQSLSLLLHLYPQSTPGCMQSGPQDRVHTEVELLAPDLPTATQWSNFFNRAARRLPLEKTPPPSHNLLILINPASGKGDAPQKAETVRPLFEHSAIPFNIQATTHAGHAHQIAHSLPLHTPTSIVCISGDGLLYEAINGLMSRTDWPEAIRHVTFGIIAGGGGNGLAKTITQLSREANTLLSQAFLVVKGYRRPLDLSTVIQAGHKTVFSFVSLSWAIISDIDFLSERWRWCGDVRFDVAAIISLLFPRRHSARLRFLPVDDGKDHERKEDVDRLVQVKGVQHALDGGGCGMHGQCPHCLKEGEEGEWRALQRYLAERTEAVGEMEMKEEANRWQTVDSEFTMLWALNIPWVTKDVEAAPLSHVSESQHNDTTQLPFPSLNSPPHLFSSPLSLVLSV